MTLNHAAAGAGSHFADGCGSYVVDSVEQPVIDERHSLLSCGATAHALVSGAYRTRGDRGLEKPVFTLLRWI